MQSPAVSNPPARLRYDRFSRVLHWSIAGLVLVQFVTGITWGFYERGSDPRFYLFRTHLAAGYVILALAIARVLWRFVRPPMPLPQGMGRATQRIAHVAHWFLYVAILVQPAIGILVTTAFGKSLGRVPNQIHITLAYVIAAVVALHVSAAIWHHFVRRDGLILRMLPRAD